MDKGSVKCNQPSRENCNKKKNKEIPKRATEDKEEF